MVAEREGPWEAPSRADIPYDCGTGQEHICMVHEQEM